MSETTATTAQASSTTKTTPAKANPRPAGPAGHRGGGGGHGRVAEKAINFGPSFRRLLTYLRPERLALVIVFLMMAASVALNVMGPKLLARATDIIVAGVIGLMTGEALRNQGVDPSTVTRDQFLTAVEQPGVDSGMPESTLNMLKNIDFAPGVGIDTHALGVIIAWVICTYVLSAALSIIAGWILNGVIQRTVYSMRAQVAGKLDSLPLSYFDRLPRGELLSRVTNDIDNITQSLQQTLQQVVQSVFMIVGVIAMMLTISPLLTLVALVTIPLSIIVVSLIARHSQRKFAQVWKSTGELNSEYEEAYTGHALVKVFGRQREVAAAAEKKNDELYEAAFGAQFISGIIMPVMGFVGNLGFVVIAVVGGLRVLSGHITIGDVQAFIQYSRQFTQPINQLASMANLLQSGVASAERVFEVLDEPEQTPDGTGTLPDPVTGHIEFEDVSFSYDPAKPLIGDLSLSVEPGQTIAIVGPTGAGKTTLVNLIMRFYDLDGGRITLDGVDTASVPRGDVRGEVGMVLQDTWLFYGTIRENIAYGNPGATEEEIQAAAKATYVDRFVRSLPEGYDTVIDEEGSNISAGEKQLLTIARAFLADPTLLILDEATSSVDTRTEVLIQEAMGALRQGRTSFVIAHRLSTIRDADVILVMEDGHIVEQGSHTELLERKGAYWRLYTSQFSAAQDAA
ncbi:MAG: ABC transporter ATP-binding protein/permease [Propionibacteriaceae bacterium]|jgi:ATP-binding cassette subfamily B protein|nr:ABC transporter ATP-binding protein/permease [Propionibacteriaceae bacterium]